MLFSSRHNLRKFHQKKHLLNTGLRVTKSSHLTTINNGLETPPSLNDYLENIGEINEKWPKFVSSEKHFKIDDKFFKNFRYGDPQYNFKILNIFLQMGHTHSINTTQMFNFCNIFLLEKHRLFLKKTWLPLYVSMEINFKVFGRLEMPYLGSLVNIPEDGELRRELLLDSFKKVIDKSIDKSIVSIGPEDIELLSTAPVEDIYNYHVNLHEDLVNPFDKSSDFPMISLIDFLRSSNSIFSYYINMTNNHEKLFFIKMSKTLNGELPIDLSDNRLMEMYGIEQEDLEDFKFHLEADYLPSFWDKTLLKEMIVKYKKGLGIIHSSSLQKNVTNSHLSPSIRLSIVTNEILLNFLRNSINYYTMISIRYLNSIIIPFIYSNGFTGYVDDDFYFNNNEIIDVNNNNNFNNYKSSYSLPISSLFNIYWAILNLPTDSAIFFFKNSNNFLKVCIDHHLAYFETKFVSVLERGFIKESYFQQDSKNIYSSIQKAPQREYNGRITCPYYTENVNSLESIVESFYLICLLQQQYRFINKMQNKEIQYIFSSEQIIKIDYFLNILYQGFFPLRTKRQGLHRIGKKDAIDLKLLYCFHGIYSEFNNLSISKSGNPNSDNINLNLTLPTINKEWENTVNEAKTTISQFKFLIVNLIYFLSSLPVIAGDNVLFPEILKLYMTSFGGKKETSRQICQRIYDTFCSTFLHSLKNEGDGVLSRQSKHFNNLIGGSVTNNYSFIKISKPLDLKDLRKESNNIVNIVNMTNETNTENLNFKCQETEWLLDYLSIGDVRLISNILGGRALEYSGGRYISNRKTYFKSRSGYTD